MRQAIIDLLKVKSLITLAIIGALVYLSVVEYIPSEAFVGIASSVITYYFTRNNNKQFEESEDYKNEQENGSNGDRA